MAEGGQRDSQCIQPHRSPRREAESRRVSIDIEWLEMAEEREGVWGTERRGWASFVPGAGAEAGRVVLIGTPPGLRSRAGPDLGS